MPRGKNLRPEAGEKTRFGQPGGPDPRQATRSGCPKHSIRKSVQYLSGKSIAEINSLGQDNEPTVAQLIAAVALKKGLKGDMQAIGYLTENIDGKLPQTNINAEYEAIKDASEEELDAIISAGLGHKAHSGAGDSGETAASGDKGEGVDAVSRPAKRGSKKPG
jgi:hypothetical protein